MTCINQLFVVQLDILFMEFGDVDPILLCNMSLEILFVLFSGRLFIADTNNSLIRYLDLKNDEFELSTLELKGFQPPKAKLRSFKRLRRRTSADTTTITIDAISSNEGNLSIEISLPNDYHFSKVLPSSSLSN